MSFDYGPSGVCKMSRAGFGNNTNVNCNMVTDGGGWIVIQRNKLGCLVYFNKNRADYEKGFEDFNTQFWYGLEEIRCITQRGNWEVRMEYQRNDKS